MRRKLSILTIVVIAASAVAAHAQQQQQPPQPVQPVQQELRGFGLGVILGEPTGVSAKAWIDRYNAIDGAAAVSLDGDARFHVHASYLRHEYGIFPVNRGALPVHYGIGMRYRSQRGSDTDRVGVRIPVGVAYHFADMPLELFGEVAPILDITPDTSLRLNAAVGLRFYFR